MGFLRWGFHSHPEKESSTPKGRGKVRREEWKYYDTTNYNKGGGGEEIFVVNLV